MNQPDPRTRRIARRLHAWYRAEARDLPWRHEPTPYSVWVSEIMLQQTTVVTAGPYFTRFMERFPAIHSLAAADEPVVLALWSGLGYYHRARNLLKTARIVVERHEGVIPSDLSSLRSLPGIGPYTAAAIRAIGYGQAAVALDANNVRVLARLEAIRGSGVRARESIETAGLRMLPEGEASAFNQALMDLGATICTARDPRCGACPVAADCLAKSRGLVGSIPPTEKRKEPVPVELAALAIRQGSEFLLMPRTGERLMKGMWEFPLFTATQTRQVEAAADWMGARVITEIGTVRHTITHHRIRINVYEARIARGMKSLPLARRPSMSRTASHLATGAEKGSGRWIPLAQIVSGRAGVALTGTARKIARLMTGTVAG